MAALCCNSLLCYNSLVKKPRLVLFDGNALIHRAFHALPPLTLLKTGETLGAVYGFALMLLKAIRELKPSCYAIAFDRAAPTFRHQMYEQYKAQRPKTPDELINQLGRVRQLVEAFQIPVFELDGYEADDIIGTLSRQASQQDIETVIITGDADAMQLVSPDVKVLYPKPRGSFSDTMLYDEAAVSQKYGVAPSRIPDFKGLMGDASDNIPGVPGIGEKNAAKLIQEYGSTEEIYERIEEVKPDRFKRLLRENEAIARKSKELATIVTEVPITLNIDDCQISHYDRHKVSELFRELGFFSLLPQLSGIGEVVSGSDRESTGIVTTKPQKNNYCIVDSRPALKRMLEKIRAAKKFAFDVETNSLDTMTADIVGISFSAVPSEAYYIPMGHHGTDGNGQQLPPELVLDSLKPVMADSGLAKLAHNAKFDMTVLAEHGVSLQNLTFDTMVAAYLLGEKSLGLKALAFSRLGLEMTAITDLIGSGKKTISMDRVLIKDCADYCCADSDITLRLSEQLEPELKKQGLWQLFSQVEMPLVPVLQIMERNGIALDSKLLRDMSQGLGERLQDTEREICIMAGCEFNINSPQQLSSVLFDKLKLPAVRRTKSGYSTGAAVLEELRREYPIVELILKQRQLAKLKSTYVDALPNLINPKNDRLHTSFNQTRTTTGRLSSSNPNLQNIPVRGELGREIRRAFIAPSGSYLLSGDYSQIDLRALAHLSQDPNLLATFHDDQDVHTATASQLFHVSQDQVTLEMRRLAKTVNFGVIYGMSDYGLEQATELSRDEARQFITSYFEKYPGVRQYLELTKKQAREKYYVQTILNRRRYIPEINSTNHQVREGALRMAINMPVQGTSADIIKVAMVSLHRELVKRGLQSKMILQVHDELIFEVPEAEGEVMNRLVPEIMSTATLLSVPLKVDIKTGRNWGEME